MYTPGYAAPEQYHGKFTLGPWTDIYAVGACMYAALTGSRAAGGRRTPGR
jgi:serine/threonine protein kinase